jgi:rhodanese-related sulfurtransferase
VDDALTDEPTDALTVDELLDEARAQLDRRATPAELQSVLDGGGLVIDIRPVHQRDTDGELPGAIVIDRNVLEWRLDPRSPHRIVETVGGDQDVVVVCNEGYASSLAAATLRRIGIPRATDLDGGYQAWLRWRADASSSSSS